MYHVIQYHGATFERESFRSQISQIQDNTHQALTEAIEEKISILSPIPLSVGLKITFAAGPAPVRHTLPSW
jgi:hypothetical protein